MNIVLEPTDLTPLVRRIVGEVLGELAAVNHAGDRLAYPEGEAAALLGIQRHVLRDARLRGDITPTKLGGRIGYERSELVAYLARQRT